jgi:hypothetical protein
MGSTLSGSHHRTNIKSNGVKVLLKHFILTKNFVKAARGKLTAGIMKNWLFLASHQKTILATPQTAASVFRFDSQSGACTPALNQNIYSIRRTQQQRTL